MARRQRSSPFEDLISIVARLPWWACLLLAVVSYVVLRSLAEPAAAPVLTHPGQLGAALAHTMWKTLAFYGQFLIPFACVIAAVISGIRQRRRGALVSGVAKSSAPDALNGMSWRDFEVLVGEGFRLQGYQVLETGGGGPDGGIDLVLKREGERFLVQCKQWRALKVGVSVVRELYGVMAARGAAGGFVVTSGSFTPEAEAFASGTNVKLIDGKKLFALIQQAKAAQLAGKAGQKAWVEPAVPAAPRTGASWERSPVQRQSPTVFGTTASTTEENRASVPTVPDCPLCDNPMVLRTAKKGPNAGASFWGCSKYPGCKGTRPAAAGKGA